MIGRTENYERGQSSSIRPRVLPNGRELNFWLPERRESLTVHEYSGSPMERALIRGGVGQRQTPADVQRRNLRRAFGPRGWKALTVSRAATDAPYVSSAAPEVDSSPGLGRNLISVDVCGWSFRRFVLRGDTIPRFGKLVAGSEGGDRASAISQSRRLSTPLCVLRRVGRKAGWKAARGVVRRKLAGDPARNVTKSNESVSVPHGPNHEASSERTVGEVCRKFGEV